MYYFHVQCLDSFLSSVQCILECLFCLQYVHDEFPERMLFIRDFEDDYSFLVFIWYQFRIRQLSLAPFEDLRLDNPILTLPV